MAFLLFFFFCVLRQVLLKFEKWHKINAINGHKTLQVLWHSEYSNLKCTLIRPIISCTCVYLPINISCLLLVTSTNYSTACICISRAYKYEYMLSVHGRLVPAPLSTSYTLETLELLTWTKGIIVPLGINILLVLSTVYWHILLLV